MATAITSRDVLEARKIYRAIIDVEVGGLNGISSDEFLAVLDVLFGTKKESAIENLRCAERKIGKRNWIAAGMGCAPELSDEEVIAVAIETFLADHSVAEVNDEQAEKDIAFLEANAKGSVCSGNGSGAGCGCDCGAGCCNPPGADTQ